MEAEYVVKGKVSIKMLSRHKSNIKKLKRFVILIFFIFKNSFVCCGFLRDLDYRFFLLFEESFVNANLNVNSNTY